MRQIENLYTSRESVLENNVSISFLDSFFKLQDYINLYDTAIKGGEFSINKLKSQEIKKGINGNVKIGGNVQWANIFEILGNIFKSHKNSSIKKEEYIISGTVKFQLETAVIGSLFEEMLKALGIERLYICLDEYSEIDKISEFSIQSKISQLIKQVF